MSSPAFPRPSLSAHLAMLLCLTALLAIASRCRVHCAVVTTTAPEAIVTTSGEGDGILDDVMATLEVSHEEEEVEDEEYEDHIPMKSFIIDDDSIRVQPVIKPEGMATGTATGTDAKKGGKKGEKKNGEKKKRKKDQNKNKKDKKKKNPCQTTHVDYCIHGECRYLAGPKEVSCKCHPDYFGERCSDKSLPTGSEKLSDMTTTTVLAVVAVLLSTISITAIVIIIVVHTRRKYSSYHCEAEEKKKLEQENGSDDVDV